MRRNQYLEQEKKSQGFILDGLYARISGCYLCSYYDNQTDIQLCEKYPDGIPPKVWNRRGKDTCPYENLEMPEEN